MIYFAFCTGTGFTKIGFTEKDVASRLSSVQTGNPHPIKLLGVVDGGFARERALHGLFAARRMTGEWFRLAREDLLALGVFGHTDKMPDHALREPIFAAPDGSMRSYADEPALAKPPRAPAAPVDRSPSRLIRGYTALLSEFGISQGAWQKMIDAGEAPRPVVGMGCKNCWTAADVEGAISRHIEKLRSDPPPAISDADAARRRAASERMKARHRAPTS